MVACVGKVQQKRKFRKNNRISTYMEAIEVKVSEYYNQTKYYGDMPEVIFNALEAAFLDGKETAIVPKDAYETMLNSFANGNQEA